MATIAETRELYAAKCRQARAVFKKVPPVVETTPEEFDGILHVLAITREDFADKFGISDGTIKMWLGKAGGRPKGKPSPVGNAFIHLLRYILDNEVE